MKPFEENRVLAPGAEHQCHGCGVPHAGPFPRSWDHLFINGLGWKPHCGPCLQRRESGEAA